MLSIFYIVRVTRSSIQGHHPDSKVYGANIGPTWGRQDPGGPHVGPMNFAIWGKYCPTFDIVASYLPIGNVYEFVRSSGRRCCNFTKPVSVFMTQCISYKFVVFAFYLVIIGCDNGEVVCILILQGYFTGTVAIMQLWWSLWCWKQPWKGPPEWIIIHGLTHIYPSGLLHWYSWWRHQMETFSVLLDLCAANTPVIGEFLTQRPVTRSFRLFFNLRLNKQLSKQSWGWWFETPSCSLWRHCYAVAIMQSSITASEKN